MELMHLPNELLEHVVGYTLPAGFEGLALTCKRFHALCTAFLAYHNRLRWHFQKFHYYKTKEVVKSRLAILQTSDAISSAFNLIARIAVEPVVAHYIQEADFANDSEISMGKPRNFVTDGSRDEAMMRLLAGSPHLKQAGLDWKEYWAIIQEDLNDGRYSQHAAAFALTLLPNVKFLGLPKWWKPQGAPNTLIDTMISKARNNPSCSTCLAQVTSLVGHGCADGRFNLDWAASFLTLPQVQYFGATWCKGGSDRNTALKYEALESVSFVHASIDEIEIARFLQKTPRLKTFKFWHSPEDIDPTQGWDLCQFVTAIEHKVGDHLVDLSVLLNDEPTTTVSPGRASLCGFKSLERLQLPLEIVSCNLTAAASDFPESLVRDLIPASVTHVSFVSCGTDEEAKALAIIFHDFPAVKAQAPSLKEIHLTLPAEATELYRDHFAKVSAEIEKAGVIFKEEQWIQSVTWEDEED